MYMHGLEQDVIKSYQAALNAKGFGPLVVDGIRGPKTIAAVKAFQAASNLTVDGIVGPKTMAALSAPIKTDNTPLPATLPPIGSGVSYGSSGGSVLQTGSPSSTMPTTSPVYTPPPQIVEVAAVAPAQPKGDMTIPLLIAAGVAALAFMS